MKKTLIALALTALPVASMADVVLYGNIKGGVETTFKHKYAGEKVDGTVTQIVDYGSKIGFKGHEHLNNNLTAIWQLEQKVDIAGGRNSDGDIERGFGTRNSFVGLKGSFGTVKAGYQSTPVMDVNDKLDIWNYSQGIAPSGVSNSLIGTAPTFVRNEDANQFGVAGLGHFTRVNDAVKRAVAVSYETPNMGGFTAKAYVSPSDNNDTSRDAAIYGLGASYENSGFFADIAGTYVKNGKNNNVPSKSTKGYQAVAQAGFENEKFLVGAAYQRAQNVDAEYDVVNEVAVTGAYNVDSALRLKASAAYGWDINNNGNGNNKSYGSWDGATLTTANQPLMTAGNGKYYQGIVGADYALSKRTVVNGQVGYLQFGKGDGKTSAGVAGVGLSHKF